MQTKFYAILAIIAMVILPLETCANESVNQQIEAAANSRVAINNMRGQVVVRGWDKNAVKVEGTLDENAERIVIQDNGNSGKHIEITVIMPENGQHNTWKGKGSNLEIHLPKTAYISAKGISSDFDLAGLNNSVEVTTVSGDVQALNLTNDVKINTVSGKIVSEDNNGRLVFTTVSGDIKDRDSAGRLLFKSVSGDINSQSQAQEIDASAISGRVRFNLAKVTDVQVNTVSGLIDMQMSMLNAAKVRCSSVSGAIDLAFDDEVNASFNLKSTAGGKIVNGISSHDVQKAQYGPSAKLFFEQGNGSAMVDVSTMSGKIKISD